jgi:hypothetical protein
MQVEQWLSDYKPAIVVTHDYHPGDIDHQDHLAVSRAVLNVVQRRPEIELLLQVEPPRGSRAFEPNLFVDVSPFASKKLAAIACHKSQSHKDYLQPAYLNLRSSWWATQCGLWEAGQEAGDVHVEAFRIAKSSIHGASALAFAPARDPIVERQELWRHPNPAASAQRRGPHRHRHLAAVPAE